MSPLSSAHSQNTPFLYGASVLLVAKELYGKGACVLMNKNPGVHNSQWVVLRRFLCLSEKIDPPA